MRYPIAIGLLFSVVCGSPAAADDFDWQSVANQKLMVGAFDNMGAYCTTLGFSRPSQLSRETLQKKLDAYLLLSSAPDVILQKWDGIITDWTQLDHASKDKTLLDRASGGLTAAVHDPDSYSQAEALYVSTSMGPLKTALSACERAAEDEFLGKYFVSGTGSVDTWEPKFKEAFAQSVTELKKYEDSLDKPARKKN